MYGLSTNICPKNHPNVGKYIIHGASGYPTDFLRHLDPKTINGTFFAAPAELTTVAATTAARASETTWPNWRHASISSCAAGAHFLGPGIGWLTGGKWLKGSETITKFLNQLHKYLEV